MNDNKVYVALIGLHQTLETDFHYIVNEWYEKPTREDMVSHYMSLFEDVLPEDYDYYLENLWTKIVTVDIRKNV